MHAVVIGTGKFGERLVTHLAENGWDVVAIEQDEERAEEVHQKKGIMVLHGDGTRIDLLKQADIEKADVFVAATGAEEVNVLSAMLAKDMGVPKIIVRIENPEYKNILERLGVDYVLLPELTAADYVYDVVISADVEEVRRIPIKGASIFAFTVPADSGIVGKRVDEIKIDENEAMIVGIERSKTQKLIIPRKEDVIDELDTVYVITKEAYVKKLAKIIT